MPKLVKLYSENSDFQRIETLQRNRAKRSRSREFFVEGVRPINQAIQHGWTINAFVYAREERLSHWAENLLAQPIAKTHYELPRQLVEKLSDKQDTSELLALVAMPPDDLARIPVRANLLAVVFDRPASPGNLGAIIRSCDALRADGLIITGHAVDVYDPETIRATTGSFFAVPVIRLASHQPLRPWLECAKNKIGPVQIVGTSAKAQRPIAECDFTRPTVLVIGNETHGLGAAYRGVCDCMATIPMDGAATSLNVACAASILLYEVDRQRPELDPGDMLYLIGLTGNIAAGKSLVGQLLAELGGRLIDADALVRDLQRPGTPVYKSIVREFGESILRADGELDRAKLGALVFSDSEALRRLETLIHPAVGQAIESLISDLKSQDEQAVIVIEAIKLIEAGLHRQCNALWVVTAQPHVQLERLMRTRGLNEAEARLRIKAQPPQSEKAALADVLIENNGTLDELRAQVRRRWESLARRRDI